MTDIEDTGCRADTEDAETAESIEAVKYMEDAEDLADTEDMECMTDMEGLTCIGDAEDMPDMEDLADLGDTAETEFVAAVSNLASASEMKGISLNVLKVRLGSLTVFRNLLNDPVISSLLSFLELPSEFGYAAFAAELYRANGGDIGDYIEYLCQSDENVYVRCLGRGEAPPVYIFESVKEELKTLQYVAQLTPEFLCGGIDWGLGCGVGCGLDDRSFLPKFTASEVNLAESYDERTKNIGRFGYGIYAKNRMFTVGSDGEIIPVGNPDPISLRELVDYEIQRRIIIDNTKALICGKPAANILLTGDAGTGKSSTVKAVCNELYSEGLRIIEIRKDQLRFIPGLLDKLGGNPLKFILFIDDLSFQKDDDSFNILKAVLEGSVSAKSKNVVIYATSNRRHIVKERFSDREGDDVHRGDTMQELVSLSERFGIHVTFSRPDKNTFLHIVRHLAAENGLRLSEEELELKAERFALERGGRSARLARQFVDGLLSCREK